MSWITSLFSRLALRKGMVGATTAPISEVPSSASCEAGLPTECEIPEHLDPITQGVLRLRNRDRYSKVFGADGHKYTLTTVSTLEVDEFERWCGSPLPLAYRKHLLTTGYGAGPAYGLLSPSQITEAIRVELAYVYDVQDRDDPAAPQSLKDTCGLSVRDAEAFTERVKAGVRPPFISAPMRGCIPICHQGCSYWAVLQLSGPCAGHVWEICDESNSWRPALRPSGLVPEPTDKPSLPPLPRPPTFDEWFQGWLDQATSDLS